MCIRDRFFLIPHHPYAISLLLKISDGFRAEEFRRLGLTGSNGDWERLVRGVIREFEENNSGVDLFYFDSDEDVFCVYSQYIDDLMLLSKMIRAACDDEKTMRTYLGKIEYIKLFWEGAPEGEPLVILLSLIHICTFSLPGMAFARDGSGGEYHLLEDGSIGYYSSEGEAGRLVESMDELFSLIVSCICWHDCCDTKQYVDSKTLEEYGQRQRNCNLEDMDVDSWRRVADALGIPTGEPLAPVLERFRKATQREPLYRCIFHEDDGSLTESYGLMFE